MSTETVIIVRLTELTDEVRRLRAAIEARPGCPWPDRLSTAEAVAYVRAAYGRLRFGSRTLRKWRDEGRLTRFKPCRWDRSELDRQFAGIPVSTEMRGRRLQNLGAANA